MSFTISAKLPAERTPLVDLAIEMARAFSLPDVPSILSLLSSLMVDDYHHAFLPGDDIPELTTKDAFLKHLEGVLPVFGQIAVSCYYWAATASCRRLADLNFFSFSQVDLREVVVSEEAGTVVTQVRLAVISGWTGIK